MFHSKFISLIFLTGLVVASTAKLARADFAHLTLNSEIGDYIGQGQTFDITYDTTLGDTIFALSSNKLPDGSPTELSWSLDRPSTPANEFASLSFGTKSLGVAIQPGVYAQARRDAFAPPGFAGLDVSFQNRGSNQVFGSFIINQLTFSADKSKILTFDADFLQRSESLTAPVLSGRFQYNVAATSVPEPSSAVSLVGVGCLLIYVQRQRRKGTIDRAKRE